jgi:hypothetical protein
VLLLLLLLLTLSKVTTYTYHTYRTSIVACVVEHPLRYTHRNAHLQ